MKHIKQYEMWTTNSTGNYSIDYIDEKKGLSEDTKEIITFIDNNIDKIYISTDNSVEFRSYNIEDSMKYEKIILSKYDNSYIIKIYYRDSNNNIKDYEYDITQYEYEYLSKLFLKTHLNIRKKQSIEGKEEHEKHLQEIEKKKLKKQTDKYNL